MTESHYDVNMDGRPDTVDDYNFGTADYMFVDTTGDGVPDYEYVDNNADGYTDTVLSLDTPWLPEPEQTSEASGPAYSPSVGDSEGMTAFAMNESSMMTSELDGGLSNPWG